MKLAYAAGILCAVGSATAGTLYVGHDANFVPNDTAIFDDTVLAGGQTTATIPGIDTHGINAKSIYVNEADGFWGYAFPGGNGTPSCYFNGGQNDVMSVTRLGGGDFDTIETMLGAGWGSPGFYWIQTYNNGVQVDSFDLDAAYGTVIGIRGADFDEVRFAAYNDGPTRDAHSETGYNAVAIDDFAWGGLVPTPGAAGLLGLAAMSAARRKR